MTGFTFSRRSLCARSCDKSGRGRPVTVKASSASPVLLFAKHTRLTVPAGEPVSSSSESGRRRERPLRWAGLGVGVGVGPPPELVVRRVSRAVCGVSLVELVFVPKQARDARVQFSRILRFCAAFPPEAAAGGAWRKKYIYM